MKQKKHFTHVIQFKFFLLRVFIAAIIILVSAASIFFVQKIAEDSSAIIDTQVPLLQSVQKIHSTVLSSGLFGSTLLSATDIHAQSGDRVLYTQRFNESLAQARLLLTEVRAQSQSPELDAYVDNIFASLQKFEEKFETAVQARVRAEEIEEASEGGLEAHTQAIALQEEAMSSLAPLTAEFDALEDYLVSRIDLEVTHVNESNKSNQILISLISLLAVLVSLFVGLIFSNRTIVKPLEELTLTAEEMANGKLSKRVEIFSRDEIGKLAYTFNKMAARLEASYDDLEKIVKEKTDALEKVLDQFETKNDDLEKSQMATINLLEDLEVEKKAVEERVKLRTVELENEKNKLLQVTSNMRGGGILLDASHEVIFANDATYEMLHIKKGSGYTPILGAFLAHFEGEIIKDHFKKCIEGNTFHVPELDGKGRVYEIFFHHLKNESETTGYFILFVDITDAKLLERSKSELVAVASHQLRTPLTAMRGNVEMLIDESFGELNKEQHELLDDIEVSTIRLITMVNEMLDITKIERGDLEMSLEKLNVEEIVASVIGDLQAYAGRHEFQIHESIPSDITVEGDKVRLRQVFQNLIDNAIKYSSHPGTLAISASVTDGVAEIIFKDNGIGVPKNEQPKLFERFYRASNTAKTASSGSGLGLYIVKSIAQQLGGDIRFESEEGVGTTFFVTLPVTSNNT